MTTWNSWPADWRTGSPGRTCPTCGTPTGRPVLRGLPTDDVQRALAHGEIDVVLGGCVVSPHDPTHQCTTCGRRFGRRSLGGS
jgi:hypothetical protein